MIGYIIATTFFKIHSSTQRNLMCYAHTHTHTRARARSDTNLEYNCLPQILRRHKLELRTLI